jgi:hypothetical protein
MMIWVKKGNEYPARQTDRHTLALFMKASCAVLCCVVCLASLFMVLFIYSILHTTYGNLNLNLNLFN